MRLSRVISDLLALSGDASAAVISESEAAVSSGDSSLAGFGVTVSFVDPGVVLAVRGEIDLRSAREPSVIVAAVIDRGHRFVTLELSELGSMDVTGIGVLAAAAERLSPSGGVLTVRSPVAQVLRLLEITGLAEMICLEQTTLDPEHLGPEQSTSAPGVPVKEDLANLTQHLRKVTAIQTDDDVVDGALRLVVALASATIGGADGVSVSLHRHGRLRTVAASDQTILEMDADQYATGEGPCVDASVEGRWFHVESLERETRWPEFIPKAHELGINSILSSPLMSGERPVGALNIYSRTAGVFELREQELAAIFATEASVILRDTGADVSDDEVADRLSKALGTRQLIAQAQGVVMDREGISDEDAYVFIRNISKRTNRTLRDVAADISGSTLGSSRQAVGATVKQRIDG